jgi:hypothetical protein
MSDMATLMEWIEFLCMTCGLFILFVGTAMQAIVIIGVGVSALKDIWNRRERNND